MFSRDRSKRGLLVWIALAALLASTALPTASAQAGTTPTPDVDRIDALVEARMAETRLPGLALAIVKDGAIVHAKGFGRADASGREVTPATPFLIASVTKSFTAFLVMQLAEEGKLALDDPVVKHLPWFRVAYPEATTRITIRHLLNHTAGLPSLMEGELDRIRAPPTPKDPENEVRRLADVALDSPPGERFQYSNVGYTTLGVVIATVTGRPYEEVLEARLFEPLGMRNAHTTRAAAVEAGLATGHRFWFGTPREFDWEPSRIATGAGFTYASADDLARFALVQLAEGRWNGTTILSPEGVEALFRTSVTVRPPPHEQAYALGSYVAFHEGARFIHHSGAGPHVLADVLLLPEEDLGVIVLMNGVNRLDLAPFTALPFEIASLARGGEAASPADGSDSMSTLLRILLAGDVLLVGGFLLSARAARKHAQSVGARFARLSPVAVLGALWALLLLLGLPGFFRMPVEWILFTVPDFGWTLVASGVLGLLAAGAAIAFALAPRALCAAAR